jgi:hypothetical protein
MVIMTAVFGLAAGCDFNFGGISRAKLEKALTSWLENHDLKADSVTCPDGEPADVGHQFECTCKVHGADIPVSVTVTDAEGTVSWEPKFLTLPRAAVEAEIAGHPNLAGHDVKIDCHDPVWVSIPDSEWTCDIIDDGVPHVATIKFTDGQGKHSMHVVPKK